MLVNIFGNISDSYAVSFEEKLEDKAQEEKAKEIFTKIRCVVCEGESITDSNAKLAQDMRGFIRDKINQGYQEGEILDILKKSYGNEILMQPPVSENTIILWLLPFIIAIGGVIAIINTSRKKQSYN